MKKHLFVQSKRDNCSFNPLLKNLSLRMKTSALFLLCALSLSNASNIQAQKAKVSVAPEPTLYSPSLT